METDAILSIITLILIIVFSATGKFRLDVVSISGLIFLYLCEVLTLAEAYSGFADPLVLMIAATFIVGLGVVKAGIADMLAQLIARTAKGNPSRMVAIVMLSTAIVSAFMSSTGTVAIMMPVAMSSAASLNVSPSKVLLPMAYGALLGSWLTLIASPPNMVVSNVLAANGYPPLGFFDYTPIGICAMAFGIPYMSWIGMHWLTDRVPVQPTDHGAGAAIVREGPAGAARRASMVSTAEPVPWYARFIPARWRKRGRRSSQAPAVTSSSPLPEAANNIDIEMSITDTADPAALESPYEPNAEKVAEAKALEESQGPEQALVKLVVLQGSAIADKAIAELKLRNNYGVSLLAIEKRGSRGEDKVHPVYIDTIIRVGNALYAFGPKDKMAILIADHIRDLRAEVPSAEFSEQGQMMLPAPLQLAEFLIPSTSIYIGKTIKEASLESRYGITVLSIRHGRRRLVGQEVGSHVLTQFDTFLCAGHLRTLRSLYSKVRDEPHDLMFVAAYPDNGLLGARSQRSMLQRFKDRWRFAVTVTLLVGMLVVMTGGWVNNSMMVLLIALLLIITRVVRTEEAYRAINWESIVLTASMLGVVNALEKTGIIADISAGIAAAGSAGPLATFCLLYVIVSVVGQLMSNTACSVLFAPIGISVAQQMGVQPQAFMIAVNVASCAAFLTPIASPVVLMVYNPGSYTVGDYVKVGSVLAVYMFLIALAIAPAQFPF